MTRKTTSGFSPTPSVLHGQKKHRYRISTLFKLTTFILFILCKTAYADVGCSNGARVTDTKFCQYIVAFRPPDTDPDPRVASALGVGPTESVRSLALVIAVGNYPHLPKESQLPAAQNDGRKLQSFLTDDQKFDEVVVLKDSQATKENINYFLGNYFRSEAQIYRSRSRFLLAFSGHGVPATDAEPGSIALSDASREDDYDHMIDLPTLKDSIYKLDRLSFHVLLLLNSCYGGGIFGLTEDGGNENDITAPGARAITAASPNNLAVALSGKDDGSIFFDAIINGVKSGEADLYPPAGILENGKKQPGGGIIRFGRLLAYLSDEIAVLNSEWPKHPFQQPWAGGIEPLDPPIVPQGGFFFLTEPRHSFTSSQETAQAEIDTKAQPALSAFSIGPISEHPVKSPGTQSLKQLSVSTNPIANQPLAKVLFRSPYEYPFRGVDVSHFGGKIDWPRLSATTHIKFAYMKATEGGTFIDKHFVENWTEASRAKLYRGAYHYFKFCTPIKAQYKNITDTVHVEKNELPIAIDLDNDFNAPYQAISPSAEYKCFKSDGLAGLKELIRKLAQHYDKPALIYIDDRIGSEIAAQLSHTSLWVWQDSNQPVWSERPWTIWQYSRSNRTIKSLSQFDFDAFYGTKEQFEGFASGTTN